MQNVDLRRQKCLIILRKIFENGHSVLLPELAWSALLQAQGSHFFFAGLWPFSRVLFIYWKKAVCFPLQGFEHFANQPGAAQPP